MGTHGLMHGIEALSLAGRQGKAMSCVGWIGVSCRSTLPSWTRSRFQPCRPVWRGPLLSTTAQAQQPLALWPAPAGDMRAVASALQSSELAQTRTHAVPPACPQVPVAVHEAVPAIGVDRGSWEDMVPGSVYLRRSVSSSRPPLLGTRCLSCGHFGNQTRSARSPLVATADMYLPYHSQGRPEDVYGPHLQRPHAVATEGAVLLVAGCARNDVGCWDCMMVGHWPHIEERRSTRRAQPL